MNRRGFLLGSTAAICSRVSAGRAAGDSVRGAGATTVAVAGLAGVGLLAWFRGRLFCNSVCPVGALLALVARRPVVRIVIEPSACVKCGLCATVCKCGAVDYQGKRIDDASCVRCFDCLSACRNGAIGLRSRKPSDSSALTSNH